MKQRVNLISTLSRKPKTPLTLGVIIWVCIIWLILLSLVYGVIFWKGSQQQEQLNVLIKDKTNLQQQIQNIQQQIQQVEALTTELSPQSESKEFLVPQGFSQYLTALTQDFPKNIWLTEIDIDHMQHKFTMMGYAKSRSLITQLLHFLGKKEAFKTIPFRDLGMRQEKEQNRFSFILSADQRHE
ncbi:MAG: PilN domain-containing protein [Gammaproteobacteria bacterium]|nr:PilN domain-containing protein [Gammaproteobacteria bacterium]